ncbi:MAG: alpha-glucan phosphorylase [Verrucomicrobiales bacterium]|nr:alpha-glucan phosphorylase [Verrucomicrobiales bacterium]
MKPGSPCPQPGSLPVDSGFDSLVELALDLRSSWNHAADTLWMRIDPGLWDLTHNPWVVLQTASQAGIQGLLKEENFRGTLDDLVKDRRRLAETSAWFGTAHAGSALSGVAYFSLEFMLAESLPIYAGGLGNVAGDQLKAAGEMGVPVFGVGLLYQQGYFRQMIDQSGWQQELFPYNDPGQLPITALRHENGEWLRLEIALPGYSVWLRTWQVRVGKLRLYLLDSNDAANFPAHRGITSELYGGGPELRLQQELILGIGGWRLLRALGCDPEIAHLNEGHAAFAILERARCFMEDHGVPFGDALAVTRAGNLFTSHTAVAAGFDRFDPKLMEQYLGHYAERQLGISMDQLMALGRRDPDDRSEPFSMAYMAVRGCAAVNGVSRLHGEVSRKLFSSVFPRWPCNEVPIGHVTNGVHMATWDSAAADELWTRACGKERWRGRAENLEEKMRGIPDQELWQFRIEARKSFVNYVRRKLTGQFAASGRSAQTVASAGKILDPNVLTLGFARRFAAYKRPNLLLQDRERLIRILNHPERPLQLVIAGKAHPLDGEGKRLIHEWQEFIRSPEVRGRAVFLSDYDMELTAQLVQGTDVWLNTPLRPWEACGTSGMKVLVNGGINLSVSDGWWEEAYTREAGWSLESGNAGGEHGAADAEPLYNLLEGQVLPEFYRRDHGGLPLAWIERMRESMALLTPRYSAGRAVRDYTERYYLPLAASYRSRAAEHGKAGAEISAWLRKIRSQWPGVRFGEVKWTTCGPRHSCEAVIYLTELDPDWVKVQIYAEPAGNGEPLIQEMTRGHEMAGSVGGYIFRAAVPAGRPVSDFTVRAIPSREGVGIPLEENSILWQH